MRAKKAKMLRKIARQETIGLPERRYAQDTQTGQIRLAACTRLFYKQLKKRVK